MTNIIKLFESSKSSNFYSNVLSQNVLKGNNKCKLSNFVLYYYQYKVNRTVLK